MRPWRCRHCGTETGKAGKADGAVRSRDRPSRHAGPSAAPSHLERRSETRTESGTSTGTAGQRRRPDGRREKRRPPRLCCPSLFSVRVASLSESRLSESLVKGRPAQARGRTSGERWRRRDGGDGGRDGNGGGGGGGSGGKAQATEAGATRQPHLPVFYKFIFACYSHVFSFYFIIMAAKARAAAPLLTPPPRRAPRRRCGGGGTRWRRRGASTR